MSMPEEEDNAKTLVLLERLSDTLSSLPTTTATSTLHMTHWRTLPPDLSEAYTLLHKSATLLKATSTKYTLMGKSTQSTNFGGLSHELHQACQLLSTACLVLYQPCTGCGEACRMHTQRACRNVLATCVSLVKSFEEGVAVDPCKEKVAAQKTGGVWESCDFILQHKLARGNRNACRREWFRWRRDCMETVEEFQEVVDLGPAPEEEEEEESAVVKDKHDGETSSWDDFCEAADTEQYKNYEISLVQPCLKLIKLTSLVLALLMECCDELAASAAASTKDDQNEEEHVKFLWQWISQMYPRSKCVGQGATDVGTLLYPPLDLSGGAEADSKESGRKEPEGTGCALVKQVLEQRNGLVQMCHAMAGKMHSSSSSSSLCDTGKDDHDDDDDDDEEDAAARIAAEAIQAASKVLPKEHVDKAGKLCKEVEESYEEFIHAMSLVPR